MQPGRSIDRGAACLRPGGWAGWWCYCVGRYAGVWLVMHQVGSWCARFAVTAGHAVTCGYFWLLVVLLSRGEPMVRTVSRRWSCALKLCWSIVFDTDGCWSLGIQDFHTVLLGEKPTREGSRPTNQLRWVTSHPKSRTALKEFDEQEGGSICPEPYPANGINLPEGSE